MDEYILTTLFLKFIPVVLAAIPVITIIICRKQKIKKYEESSYYQATKAPYYAVKHDAGRRGEYLIYEYLKNNGFESFGGKFLFNLYIPRNGNKTTEIDLLLICPKGIFVFESKNYRGWIYGRETQKYWMQILPAGRNRSYRERFYNPIMQNKTHIRLLKNLLGKQIPMHSIIVFSDRCTFKNIVVDSNDVSVIKFVQTVPVVSYICSQFPNSLLSETEIDDIYNKLYLYTQVSEAIKEQHAISIRAECESSFYGNIEPTSNNTELSASAGILPDRQNKTFIYDEKAKKWAAEKQLFCPRCGCKLVLRTAKRGWNAGNQFYGCSNYPKCKYIQNIKSVKHIAAKDNLQLKQDTACKAAEFEDNKH